MNLNSRRGLLFIFVGVVAALAAGLVVFALAVNLGRIAAQNEATAAPPAASTPVPAAEVIVASQDIQPSTIITTSMVLTASYPVDLVPADAFTNTAELLGQVSKQRIPSGLPLLKREFIDAPGGRTGASVVVPKGKVLAAFPSTDILNSTGAVQPGDHVDILLTLPISGTARLDNASSTGSQVEQNAKVIVAQTTLQNVEVYNTGQWVPPNADPNQANTGLKVVTFVVDHQEALILKYIKDSGGTIDLVVRSLEDNTTVPTDPVNIDYIVDLYKFIGLPKPNP